MITINVKIENKDEEDIIYSIANKTNFKVNKEHTSILKLKSFEHCWKNLKTNGRNEYRKSVKKDVEFSLIKTKDYETQIFKILSSVFKRKNINQSFSKRLFFSYCQYLTKYPEEGFTIGAFKNKKLINFSNFLIYKDTAYYYQGGTLPDYLSIGASTFTMVEGMRECINRNVTYLDLNGLGDKNVRKWKESFGGEKKIWLKLYKFGALPNLILGNL